MSCKNISYDLLHYAGSPSNQFNAENKQLSGFKSRFKYARNDSSQMHSVLSFHKTHDHDNCFEDNGSNQIQIASKDFIIDVPKRRNLVNYIAKSNQKKYFQTRWRPDAEGKMIFTVGRKSGSASVELGFNSIDKDLTYHTWKRMTKYENQNYSSNIEHDTFLTVQENANRSDRLPCPVNRSEPFANPDGPFEKDIPCLPTAKIDHLDRTCTPREAVPRSDFIAPDKLRHINLNRSSNIGLSTYRTGLCPIDKYGTFDFASGDRCSMKTKRQFNCYTTHNIFRPNSDQDPPPGNSLYCVSSKKSEDEGLSNKSSSHHSDVVPCENSDKEMLQPNHESVEKKAVSEGDNSRNHLLEASAYHAERKHLGSDESHRRNEIHDQN